MTGCFVEPNDVVLRRLGIRLTNCEAAALMYHLTGRELCAPADLGSAPLDRIGLAQLVGS
jgi:hypothetical protein